MKRALCLLLLTCVTIFATATGNQDFASKYMQICKGDTAVHCITVSPKMMAQMLKSGTHHKEDLKPLIKKLKSARIITTSQHGEGYFQIADELLKKNSSRFKNDGNYRNSHSYGSFFIRKVKGQTVELILLHANVKAKKFILINLTGKIDDEFKRYISMLSL